jgi:hypothetical protein
VVAVAVGMVGAAPPSPDGIVMTVVPVGATLNAPPAPTLALPPLPGTTVVAPPPAPNPLLRELAEQPLTTSTVKASVVR